MSCPYILKFSGAFYYNGLLAIVTTWMAYGNIVEYLEKHADADRLRLVSLTFFLASNISLLHILPLLTSRRGRVRYPHSCNIVHRDIKAVSPSNSHGGFDYENLPCF